MVFNLKLEAVLPKIQHVPTGYNDTLAEAESIRTVAGLDYVDLLLVHWPTGGQQGTIAGNVSSDPLCNTTSAQYDEKECRLATWRAMVQASCKDRLVFVVMSLMRSMCFVS